MIDLRLNSLVHGSEQLVEKVYYINGQRGSRKMICGDYSYVCASVHGNRKYWICAKQRSKNCRARIVTDLEEVQFFAKNLNHNHNADHGETTSKRPRRRKTAHSNHERFLKPLTLSSLWSSFDEDTDIPDVVVHDSPSNVVQSINTVNCSALKENVFNQTHYGKNADVNNVLNNYANGKDVICKDNASNSTDYNGKYNLLIFKN